MTMLEVYSIGNECIKTLSWKYTLMVREVLIYNDTVYMMFISFGKGLVIVTLFNTHIPYYLFVKTFRLLTNKAVRPRLKFEAPHC